MSCGLLGPSISGSPARTRSPSCTFTWTPRGSEVLAGLAALLRHDQDLAQALHDAAVLDQAVDLADDGGLARLARLEQLDDARQTARDVLGLGRLARDLGQHVAGRDRLAVVHHQVGVRRHVVLARHGPALAADLDRGLLLLVGRVDDDEAREARDLVHLLVHRHALDDVLEADLAGLLGEDREGVGVPLDERLALLDLLVLLHLHARAVDDLVALAVAALGVLHDERPGPVHDDQAAVLGLDDLQALELHHAGVAGLEGRLLGDARRRAADVERPHRQLGAGLADRLRGDDAHRQAELDQPARSPGRGRSTSRTRRGATRRSAPSGSSPSRCRPPGWPTRGLR